MPYRSARKSGILSAVGPVLVDFGVNMRRDFALVGERGRRVCMENICAAYEQVNGNEDPDRSYFLEDVERTVYDVPVVALGLACTRAVRAALLNAPASVRSPSQGSSRPASSIGGSTANAPSSVGGSCRQRSRLCC